MSERQAETDQKPECNWTRCHRSPNPCFAWCKCRCHVVRREVKQNPLREAADECHPAPADAAKLRAWLRDRADRLHPEPAPDEHDFLPVRNHPDDDECAHRADGTDATYCGEPRTWHEHHPRCYQNTGVPDDLPDDLCDCRVLRMIEEADRG